MVSFLGLLVALIGSWFLYIALTDYTHDEIEGQRIGKVAVCMMGAGAIIILVNAWIVKPIVLVLGG